MLSVTSPRTTWPRRGIVTPSSASATKRSGVFERYVGNSLLKDPSPHHHNHNIDARRQG